MFNKISLISLLAVSVLAVPVYAEEEEAPIEVKEDGRVVFDLSVNKNTLQSDEDETLPWLKNKKPAEGDEVIDSAGDEISEALEDEVTEGAVIVDGDDVESGDVAEATVDGDDAENNIELVKEKDIYVNPEITLGFDAVQVLLTKENKEKLSVLFEAENRDVDVKVRLYAKAGASESLALRQKAMKELYQLREYFIELGKKDHQISLFVIVEPDVDANRIEVFL